MESTVYYRQAIVRPHRPRVRIEVWKGGVKQFDEVAFRPDMTSVWFHSGQVQATLHSQVTRTLDMNVDETFFPEGPESVFAPFGSELRAFRGVDYGDGSFEEWPVFVGPIVDVGENDDGSVSISAQDQAVRVTRNKFIYPHSARPPRLVMDEMFDLISGGFPDAQFGVSDSFLDQLKANTWEEDRGRAIDELAESIGGFWYALADGRFVIRRDPVAALDPPSLRDLKVGGADGQLSTVLRARDADDLFNVVVARSESTEGVVPMRAVAQDSDPASATWVGGPYGQHVEHIELPNVASFGAVQSAARDALARGLSWTQTTAGRGVPDATIELGDVYDVVQAGRVTVRQVVTDISMPLDLEREMTLRMTSPGVAGGA